VEKSVGRLTEHGVIQIGSPEATVSVKVTCGECGRTYGIATLFQRRKCRCGISDEAATDDREVTSCTS